MRTAEATTKMLELQTTFLNNLVYNLNKNVNIIAKTSDYSLLPSDDILLCDATSAPFAVSLPTAVGNAGKQYNIKKIDSSINAITIIPNGTETIDSATELVISTQWENYTLVSDGVNWNII